MSDEYEEQEKREDTREYSQGFHFVRLGAITVLTFIVLIIALALDSLSTWNKIAKNVVNPSLQCTAKGECGWRHVKTEWIDEGFGCPAKEQEFNFADSCDANDDYCDAYHAGNVYMAFNIFCLIFNIFTMLILLPLYCRERSIFPCQVCNTKTHIFLGILLGCQIFCNFIVIVVWFGMGDGGICDNADPTYVAFASQHDLSAPNNFPSFSMAGVIIIMVANVVTCGAVCWCWGDNRHYGDEMDAAKRERQREAELQHQQTR